MLQDVEDPQTVEDFKHNISNIIQNTGLDDFFAPGDPHVQEIAEKAAVLRKDVANPLSSPPMIMKLARIALYQPVLYIGISTRNRKERERLT